MINEKYDTLIKEIREISSDIARIDGDLTKDRQDLADFKVQMATLTEEVKQLRNEMAAITKDVGDKVKDTLKPAQKEIGVLTDEIKKKKSIIITKSKFVDWIKSRIQGGEKK